ncbi:MAG: hypothetical protein ACRDKZ_03200 [Actinomycetota bacterium]
MSSGLPLLLSGPIVRRSEPSGISIWIATSEPVDARVVVHDLSDGKRGDRMGGGAGERVQLGRNLFVHMVTAKPRSDAFPTAQLLGYDLELTAEGDTLRLSDLGLLEGTESLVYEGLALPSLLLQEPGTPLTVLHGSCRELHGHGRDALALVDFVLARRAHDAGTRPTALFLTGDQIYADDIAGPLLWHLRTLGAHLLGYNDEVPGMESPDSLPLYGRQAELKERASFTSPKGSNHLLSFSEFAAMYVVSWSPGCWPEQWVEADHVIDPRGQKGRAVAGLKKKYRDEAERLDVARQDLWRIRRALANLPTYMIFDDHDTTDDWNITGAWKKSVSENVAGRRIVANALGAFWAFQGWGNAPDHFDEAFKKTLTAHLGEPGGDGRAYEDLLWSFERWCFTAPTSPPALCLDTRTQRAYDSPDGGACLLGERGRELAVEVARAAGHEAGRPLILVSPVPVCGLELQERRQKFLVGKVGPYEIDFEAWHSNLQGFIDFMTLLVEQLELPWAVILSGDVHYGMTIGVQFTLRGEMLPVSQFVSSSFRHSGALSKAVLVGLGRIVRTEHERLGWCSPPPIERSDGVRNKLMLRATNTDEWSDDAPVSLAPKIARHLKIESDPDFEERRLYLRPEGKSSVLIGDNNVGLVHLEGNTAGQSLLTHDGGELREFRAMLDVRTARPPELS